MQKKRRRGAYPLNKTMPMPAVRQKKVHLYMEPFKAKLCENYGLQQHELDLLLGHMQQCTFQKRDFIVREGDTDTHLYLIKSGVLRAFRNNDGEEITLWFAGDGEMIASVWGYCLDSASQICIEIESDTEAFCIPKSRLDTLCNESLLIANIIRRMFEHHALILEDFSLFYADNQSAEERYLSLMKKHPEMLNQIPLKKLASYLFITPQSLSRIRAGLKNRL